MKKVLSLVLAAAMVMGMSVSAFAADFSKPASSTGDVVNASKVFWGDAHLVDADGKYKETIVKGIEGSELKVDFKNMVEGDAIYFEIKADTDKIVGGSTHEHDEDCFMFDLTPGLTGMEAVLVDSLLGWDGKVTVGDFVDGVVAVMGNIGEEAEAITENEFVAAIIEAVKATAVEEDVDAAAVIAFVEALDLPWEKIGAAFAEYSRAKAVEYLAGIFCTEEDVAGTPVSGNLNQLVPKNWTLKIENSEYIDDEETELVYVTAKKAATIGGAVKAGVYAKVVLNDEFKAQDEEEAENELEFYMYIWDTEYKVASDKATVHLAFAEYKTITIGKGATKADGSYVNYKELIPAAKDAYYKLEKGLNSAEVVFELDNSVYVTAKMWNGDKYMIKSAVDAKWSKELSKEYDTDIEILTIESNLDIREVIWESKKDNKQVVELVDGVLVAVDSEYVTKYEVIDNKLLAKGYIAETEEGSYALIDADIELIVPEVEVEADKANPSTGASDFVGAAVAMAVVSVAAAGALALKK